MSEPYESNSSMCRECNGHSLVVCPDCHGEFHTDGKPSVLSCPRCNGSGQALCPACHGVRCEPELLTTD